MDRIHETLKKELPLNQWSQFELYLDDRRLAIDINGVKNAIRPYQLGLKSYLFFGSLEAEEDNAVLYTLIENCKAEGVNPRSHLEYVLGALGEQPAAELTHNKYQHLTPTSSHLSPIIGRLPPNSQTTQSVTGFTLSD